MELPLGGPALRHYTQSRPRPHRQKLNYRPSRPQETIIECENEDFELMGRVDEGVEEFFTKKVLPTETLKKEDEDEEEEKETITVHDVAPASAVPCPPPPTKTLRRKLGDFFTLKKRRGLKSETSHEGRPKKASIADFIRPLREVARGEKDKDKDKVKEPDKENEKEKRRDVADTGEDVQGISISDAPPMRGEAVPPRRALREGKSQSLILLSGSASGATRNKKLDGQNSFEQKLHLMLQRIGVSKPQPGETQNQEGEMKKAESEGTIIDSKPEPPSTKPRTMSASSDTRHQLRSSVSAHESAGKPPLLPKPVLKPAPPAPTSGRNTPENELGQIVEGEPNTPTKLSPDAAQAVSVTSTPTVATISDTAPDSSTVLPSSTVIPTDADICTDSVDSTAEATAAPANVTEPDSTASTPEFSTAAAAELPSATIEKALTDTTTPAPPSPEPDSDSTMTTPSITTLEMASTSDNSATTTHLSTELTMPEPNGTVFTVFTVDTTAPASTSISDTPAILPDDVVAATSDDLTPSTPPTTSQSEATAVLLDVETTSEAPVLSNILITVTPASSSEAANVTSSSSTTTTTSTICTVATSATPASTTCTTSPSIITPTSTVSEGPTPVTSITSSTTQMTSQTTTMSTSSPVLVANSDLPISTALSPVIADDSSDVHSGQDTETSPPETSTMDVKDTAEELLEVVRKEELTLTAESKTLSDSETQSKAEELTIIAEVIMKDNEEKPKEEQIKANEVAVAETKGTSELSTDEVMIVDQKQQETKSSDEK